MNTLILCGYFSILLVLCVFSLHRLHLTRIYQRQLKNAAGAPPLTDFPRVTVQLPMYNERFVATRLIDACAQLDYPKDRLEIQVLDDSTDETTELARQRVQYWQAQGCDIQLIHRTDRTGFKAGALAEGMAVATGDLIAVFDADFVPQSDFLRRTLSPFQDPQVGMVQARWTHLNREADLLTQVQAILLDAHFVIEHGGRFSSGRFFNFNGTAGVWRRSCIADAGGWQHDTLTEDLDLSYRAQLRGWRFVFLPDVVCPAELPATVAAFKSQQFRWAKGSVQVMRKLLPQIWASDLPRAIKWEASFHLCGNFAYVLTLLNCLVFVVPAMVIRRDLDWRWILAVDGPLFLVLTGTFIYFYQTAQQALGVDMRTCRKYIPALMAVGLGLTVNNARAVIEALLGKQSPFVRTPKDGQCGATPTRVRAYALPFNRWNLLEVGIGLGYTLAVVWAIVAGVWASLPFLILFQNGFLFMGLATLWEQGFRKAA